MSSYDISDCLAMSDDGAWYAFPGELSRGDVITAMTDVSNSWIETLRLFAVKRGHVVQGLQGNESWYWEAEATDVGAIACWIVRRR